MFPEPMEPPLTLLNLPDELLLLILSFLRTTSHISLSLTCSRLSALAIPYIYHSIHLREQFPQVPNAPPDTYQTWLALFPGLRKLSSLLLTRPDLAYHVRHLSLRETFKTRKDVKHWEGIREDLAEFQANEGNAQIAQDSSLQFQTRARLITITRFFQTFTPLEKEFGDAVDRLAITHAEATRWKRELSKSGNEDALLGVLLPALSRLESLDFMLSPYSRFWDRAIQLGRMPDSDILTNLKSVMIANFDATIGGGWESVVPFMKIPSVRRIYVLHFTERYISEQDRGIHPFDLPAGSSNVEYLEIRRSCMGPPTLRQFLAAPKGLKSFIYDVGKLSSRSDVYSKSALEEGLMTHKDTLEEVALDIPISFDVNELWGSRVSDEAIAPLNLVGLEGVKRVRCAAEFLVHLPVSPGQSHMYDGILWSRFLVNFLPEGVEEFEMTHVEDRFKGAVPAMFGLLEEIGDNGKMSELKKVVWSGNILMFRKYWDCIKKMFEISRQKGVEFEIWEVPDIAKTRPGGRGLSPGEAVVERGWGWNNDIEWEPGLRETNKVIARYKIDVGELCEEEDEDEIEDDAVSPVSTAPWWSLGPDVW